MTRGTLLNRLIAEGSLERVAVNRYRVNRTGRTTMLHIPEGTILTREQADLEFFVQIGSGNADYVFRTLPRNGSPFVTREPIREEPRVLRTINRSGYHSHGNGTGRYGLSEALDRIERDADGVRRSFGLEWEISSLNASQEDKLARLLDTMPAHFTERDGSLTSSGVEIIFLPLGLNKIKEVWNKLQTFCRENGVRMEGTGAHITYGVSNANCSREDLQIRINRIALAVKAASTQRQIRQVFGRDFTGYASLPNSTTYSSHSNAWSASRGTDAYELRLCAWEGNIDKITEFMKATEFVFNRTFNANDFLNIFSIMGSDCSGI